MTEILQLILIVWLGVPLLFAATVFLLLFFLLAVHFFWRD